jgi:hypothetical protein
MIGATVTDEAPDLPGLFAVAVSKTQNAITAKSAFDPTDGDSSSSFTPAAKGGAGIYTVAVTKSANVSTPTEAYKVVVRCWTSSYVVVPIPVPAAGETGSVFYLGMD